MKGASPGSASIRCAKKYLVFLEELAQRLEWLCSVTLFFFIGFQAYSSRPTSKTVHGAQRIVTENTEQLVRGASSMLRAKLQPHIASCATTALITPNKRKPHKPSNDERNNPCRRNPLAKSLALTIAVRASNERSSSSAKAHEHDGHFRFVIVILIWCLLVFSHSPCHSALALKSDVP